MILAGWPGFRLVSRGKRYAWEGTLRPTPLSPEYTIRITCADWLSPKVIVISPPLRPCADARIPHRYPDGSLCLCLPEEWTGGQYIADTIIPWTSLWLHHYEVWLVTGKWLGGGAHPAADKIELIPEGREHVPNPVH